MYLCRKGKFILSYLPRNSHSSELKAGKDAIILINECIEKKRNFSMETTLSGKLPYKLFKKAKHNGFEIIMFYVGLDDVNTNIRRVAQRVKSGGHNIPTEDILRRKERSINNFIKSINLIDHIQVIDNSTVDAEIVLVYRDNRFIYKSKCIPKWAHPIESAINKER